MTDITEADQRAAVITAARSWLRTPFHDCAAVKGIGVDCAHFLRGAYVEAGLVEPFPIAPYSPQFMLHQDEELFLSYVERFAHEIDEGQAGMGDIVLYRVGRLFAHGAIIVEWPGAVIHAFKSFGCVTETPAFEADLKGRKVRFFSWW